MRDLATIVKNRIQPKLATLLAFGITTRPTASQQHVLDLQCQTVVSKPTQISSQVPSYQRTRL